MNQFSGRYSNELILSNLLTRAKFNYSRDEVKILIYIIRCFQPNYIEQFSNKIKPIQENLFGDKRFEGIRFTDIHHTISYERIRAAFLSLHKKSVVFEKDGWESHTTLILEPEFSPKGGVVNFQLSNKIVAIFEPLGSGFLLFDPETFFKCNSLALQRLYWFCCQFEDTGIFKIHAKELKQIIGVDESAYPVFSHFKKHVLIPAQKKLNVLFVNQESKLKFEFDASSEKFEDGDDWNRMLVFKIISIHNRNRIQHSKISPDEQRQTYYNYLVYAISRIFDNNPSFVKVILRFLLSLTTEQMLNLKLRLEREIEKREHQLLPISSSDDLQKVVTTILKQDYKYGQ